MKIWLIKEDFGIIKEKKILNNIVSSNIKYNIENFKETYNIKIKFEVSVYNMLRDLTLQKAIQINSYADGYAFWVKSFEYNTMDNTIQINVKSYLSGEEGFESFNYFRVPTWNRYTGPFISFIGSSTYERRPAGVIMRMMQSLMKSSRLGDKYYMTVMDKSNNISVTDIQTLNVQYINEWLVMFLKSNKMWLHFKFVDDELNVVIKDYKELNKKLFPTTHGVIASSGEQTAYYSAQQTSKAYQYTKSGDTYDLLHVRPYGLESGINETNSVFIDSQLIKNQNNQHDVYTRLNEVLQSKLKDNTTIKIDTTKIGYVIKPGDILHYGSYELIVSEVNFDDTNTIELTIGNKKYGLIKENSPKEQPSE